MIENVWTGIHDHLQRPIAVVEIWDEDFDDDAWIDVTNRADRFTKMFCSTIFKIIASDGGDDDVFEIHAAGGFCDTGGFVGFQCIWLGGFDSAETTGAGALITSDHEGCGALSPALPAVRALGLFTDRYELEIGDQGFGRPESRIVGKTDFNPRGFLLSVELGIHFHFRATAGHGVTLNFKSQSSTLKGGNFKF